MKYPVFATIFITGLIAMSPLTVHAKDKHDYCITKSSDPEESSERLFLKYGNPATERKKYIINSQLRIANTKSGQAEMLSREETLKVLGTPRLEDALTAQHSTAGLELAIVDLLRFPAPNDPNLSLVLNRLCVDFESEGVMLHIAAKKTYSATGKRSKDRNVV